MNQQDLNELVYAKSNRNLVLAGYKETLVAPMVAHVNAWLSQEFPFDTREDLQEIVLAVQNLDPEEVCWDILCNVLLDGSITLQAVLGMFFHQIECEMAYRKGRVLEVFIDAVLQCPQVELKLVGKYLNLVCKSKVNVNTDTYGYILPALYPEPVTDNSKAGYASAQFHVITGGKLKQNGGELCLDHINRLNFAMYSVDTRLMDLVKPVFESELKWKDKVGRYETEVEVEARLKQFMQFDRELPEKVKIMVDQGNQFFFKNRYDIRGRTYLKAYHFDYVGNKYSRALIHHSTKEHVLGADKYFN